MRLWAKHSCRQFGIEFGTLIISPAKPVRAKQNSARDSARVLENSKYRVKGINKVDSSELAGSISVSATVVAAKEQISADLADDEVVILNLESGVYYGLSEVGARIWRLIGEPRDFSDIRDVLLEEYDVDADRCERELLALLSELADQGLVVVRNGSGT
jgi:hypothetical protein